MNATAFLSSLSATDRVLLKASIASPSVAEAAWNVWIDGLPATPPAEAAYARPMRDLLPLLATRRNTFTTSGPKWLTDRLSAAALIEEQRLAAVRTVVADVLALPALREAAPLVVGGLALGETVYPTRNCRHTTTLQLLLPPAIALRRLVRQLTEQGLELQRGGRKARALSLMGVQPFAMRHPTGLAITIGSDPLFSRFTAMTYAGFLPNTVTIEATNGLSFRSPCLPDAFALEAAAWERNSRRDSLLWLADAIYLSRALGTPPITNRASVRLAAVIGAINDGVLDA